MLSQKPSFAQRALFFEISQPFQSTAYVFLRCISLVLLYKILLSQYDDVSKTGENSEEDRIFADRVQWAYLGFLC